MLASLIIIALIMIGMSVPFLLSKVPPNNLYGFRTKHTMSNPKVWYSANIVVSRLTIICGALMLALAATLPFISRIKGLSNTYVTYIGLAFEVLPPIALLVTLMFYDRTL